MTMVSLSIKRVTASTLLKRMAAEVTQTDRYTNRREVSKEGLTGKGTRRSFYKCRASHRVSAIIAGPVPGPLSPAQAPCRSISPSRGRHPERGDSSFLWGSDICIRGVQKCCWWPANSDTNHQMASLFACSVALGQAPMQVQPTRPGATRLGR
jgi:hypothetical protein